ncbi:MAG: thiamine diphosphokinase [Bacteroidetes bacterium]|nr:thiamine diphosphokinase [Bacteroidota bacterium]
MSTQKQKTALVICNGKIPPREYFTPYLKERPVILCADGGANKARNINITPHLIIGDLDSITEQTRKAFQHIPIIHLADQYSTDLEKALEYLLQHAVHSAVVFGATGNRSDHLMANFSILLKYHSKLHLQFVDEYSTVEIVDKKISFKAKRGQQISLMPMGRCEGIVTKGLKYPLENEALALGVREGSSNEAVSSTVSVSVARGALLLFKIHPDAQ